MDYMSAVRQVVQANASELRGDLDLALHSLARAKSDVSELERRVLVLQSLLDLDESPSREDAEVSMTLHEAMALVLRESAAQTRRAGDLAAEINRRNLYRMRDGRPVEAQQIHARVGHYPHLFAKEGTFIKLVG